MESKLGTPLLILLLLVLVLARNCTYQMESSSSYYVLANRSSECPLKYNACNTLDVYIEKSVDYFTNNTTFVFQEGSHVMEEDLLLTVTETVDLVLMSEGDEVVAIDCRDEFSLQFAFKYVQNVTIEKLSFLNCSSPSHTGVKRSSILGLAISTNIHLKFIKVLNPRGNGIFLNNIVGELIMCHIDVVKGYTRTDALTSMYFSSCHQPSYIGISNSSFVNNKNEAYDKGVKSPYAGGLSITVKCFDTNINITNVTFTGNRGGDGGNLAILIHNMTSSQNNIVHSIIISECLFHKGHGLVGGAIYISFMNSPGENKQVCESKGSYYHPLLLIINSVFSENHAGRTGGAIFMKYHESLFSDCTVQRINIKYCRFESNSLKETGIGGTAISSFNYIIPGYLYSNQLQTEIDITESTFKDNYVKERHGKDLSGSGVILAKSHKYFAMINITIDSNQCSGLLALDSNIIIEGIVTIRNNTGYSGGGMLICQNAILYLKPRATLNIESNYANHSGGGILVESECSQSKPPCFYQLAAMDPREYYSIRINLINNTANYAGDQLFGGDVDYCYMIQLSNNSEAFNNSLAVYQKAFHIVPNVTIPSRMQSSVTSMPRCVCFCQQTITSTIDINCTSELPDQYSYPGETFTIPVAIVGQLNGLVPGIVRTEFEHTQRDNSLELHQRFQRIDSTQREPTYTVYSSEKSVTLLLAVQQSVDESVLIHVPKVNEVKVHIHLNECPLGFELSKSKPSCVCNTLFNSETRILCNITKHSIYRPSQTWLGCYEEDRTTMVAFSKYCPLDYCKKTDVWIPTDRHNIDQDLQCHFNRTGLLCGQCPHGMSVGLSDSTCRRHCSNYGLFKVILFLGLGIVIIAMLILLNITITQGTISGIIFYANIVVLHKSVFFENEALKPLKIVLSWINMGSGISACLYKGMDSYSKAWLQYTLPMYLWLLTALIIYFSKKSSKVMRLVGKNAVKILATIILLSYTKLIQAIITSLHYLRLDVFNTSSGEISEIKRWYSDASVKYLEGKHVPLFLVGVFFATISLIFTMSLLCIQYLQKVSHFRLFFWVVKFKPFFDAYTGPFSFHGRFWTGLLLLMRLLLTIVTSLNFLGAEVLNVIATIIVLTILLVLAWIVRPGIYRKWTLDLLECSFLLNLLLLCIGTVFIVYVHDRSDLEHMHLQQYLLTAISASIAVATAIWIILYHTWLSVRDLSCSKRIRLYCNWNLFKFSCHKNYFWENEEISDRHLPPVARFDSDREPLLVD